METKQARIRDPASGRFIPAIRADLAADSYRGIKDYAFDCLHAYTAWRMSLRRVIGSLIYKFRPHESNKRERLMTAQSNRLLKLSPALWGMEIEKLKRECVKTYLGDFWRLIFIRVYGMAVMYEFGNIPPDESAAMLWEFAESLESIYNKYMGKIQTTDLDQLKLLISRMNVEISNALIIIMDAKPERIKEMFNPPDESRNFVESTHDGYSAGALRFLARAIKFDYIE